MLKKIMIPVAAFAFTVTAASAFQGTEMLSKLNIGLTDAQTSALEEAHAIREEAHIKAKAVLDNAGIDETKMQEIHAAMRELHKVQHDAMKAALESNDYAAFIEAIKDSPLADTIDTEAEFTKLKEAHKLMEAGDKDGAKVIMDELGLEGKGGFGGGHGGPHGKMGSGEGNR